MWPKRKIKYCKISWKWMIVERIWVKHCNLEIRIWIDEIWDLGCLCDFYWWCWIIQWYLLGGTLSYHTCICWTACKITVHLTKSVLAHAHLGHVVGQGQVRPRDVKVKCIFEYQVPTIKKELTRLLCMQGYYRMFCQNFADIVSPLPNMLTCWVKSKVCVVLVLSEGIWPSESCIDTCTSVNGSRLWQILQAGVWCQWYWCSDVVSYLGETRSNRERLLPSSQCELMQ